MDGTQRTFWLSLVLLAAACGTEANTGSDSEPFEQSEAEAGSGVSIQTGTSAGGAGSRAWKPEERPEASRAGAPASTGAGGSAGAPAAMSGAEKTPAAMSGGAPAPKPPAAAASTPADAEPKATEPEAADAKPPAVRWLGRVDASDPQAVRFDWAGSGFAATVKGSTIAVRLESQESSIYYWPVVDGEPGERIKVEEGEHTVTLAEGLSDAEHQIELYRDTEADGPVSVFMGFEEGELVGAPAAPDRFFEIVGDSISVGFGSLETERHGDNPSECGADHSSSSWFLTYGAVAARELKSEISTIARSGYGVVRGYGQNMNVMPPLFGHTLCDYDDPTWTFERIPAALIINLGTNDWNGGDPGSSYESAYIKFITQVREHYPDTLILVTIGPTLEDGRKRQVEARLERVIDARHEAGDDKIDMIDIGIQDTEVTGCGWHPSKDEHERVGKVLAEELRARLGW
jgi:hypothetical protein